ncbi:hypothetical protein MMA48_24365, partial [Salmonella enterica]|nr:hypothetical protein [Salmonella enterica]
RYPSESGAPLRFLLLHRPRTFSDTEQAYIGWERKRGKLELLIGLLADGGQTRPFPFVDLGPSSRVAAETRYLVTLDGDTQLPSGRLRDL